MNPIYFAIIFAAIRNAPYVNVNGDLKNQENSLEPLNQTTSSSMVPLLEPDFTTNRTSLMKRKRKGIKKKRKNPIDLLIQADIATNATVLLSSTEKPKKRRYRKRKHRKNKTHTQKPNILEITTAKNINFISNLETNSSIHDLIQKLNENPEHNFEQFHQSPIITNNTLIQVPSNSKKLFNLHVSVSDDQNATSPKTKPHRKTKRNRCIKNDDCDHICHPKGKQKCSCFAGFHLAPDKKSCFDIDECTSRAHSCQKFCKNTVGSYECFCPAGFRVGPDEKSCEDINECLLRNGHGPCQDACVNSLGSYRCSCKNMAGTRLGSDNHTCTDVDECAEGRSGCSHNCINIVNAAICTCPEGLELSTDWKTCQDINECEDELVTRSCKNCVNTDGSYKCLDFSEYQNDQAMMSGLNQVACKPLFPDRHGFVSCSRKGAYKSYTKSGRKRIKNSPGTTCKLNCPAGYRLIGQYHVTCGFDGKWQGKMSAKCLIAAKPVLTCPANQKIQVDFNEVARKFVKFPAPKTNVHWNYVKAHPDWAKNLSGYLSVGQHVIYFTVEDPTSKLTAKCSFRIDVEKVDV